MGSYEVCSMVIWIGKGFNNSTHISYTWEATCRCKVKTRDERIGVMGLNSLILQGYELTGVNIHFFQYNNIVRYFLGITFSDKAGSCGLQY